MDCNALRCKFETVCLDILYGSLYFIPEHFDPRWLKVFDFWFFVTLIFGGFSMLIPFLALIYVLLVYVLLLIAQRFKKLNDKSTTDINS
ncbi:hypothetical protein IQ215_10735 [Cyanobacterium stanieri LEGE 03274]|uniref:Uncharacterized protein n=1 Tax=Cyanobacterium stanieri LEGE 03274 TaxID=1828756 RepID=A0ABR9V6P3_9CHRO|nr:hypothetical protein [Cyanobacterium stanieri]MBE9223171.1 hypothetical protein [Cyanobacterium stanieri LEGE 03274]